MTQIAHLKAAAIAIDDEVITSENLESNIARSHAAWGAYDAEKAAAMALKAKYESMGDVDGAGVCNAGDTFGGEADNSVEYWKCAVDSVQLLRDFAA